MILVLCCKPRHRTERFEFHSRMLALEYKLHFQDRGYAVDVFDAIFTTTNE